VTRHSASTTITKSGWSTKTKDVLRRIRRFEQISGWPLASTESLAEVWLAMRSTAAVPEG
jgi:hypothetical protein